MKLWREAEKRGMSFCRSRFFILYRKRHISYQELSVLQRALHSFPAFKVGSLQESTTQPGTAGLRSPTQS